MKRVLLTIVLCLAVASYARSAWAFAACGNPFSPTAGTGTVVTGSSDCGGEVTGGTSPVTVTWGNGVTYANAPFCEASDLTSATAVKVVPSTTTLIITTTGTDSFMWHCDPR